MPTSTPTPSSPFTAGGTFLERRASRASSATGPFDLPTLQQRLASLMRRVALGGATLASTSAALGHGPRLPSERK
jgi:hypothetical protein